MSTATRAFLDRVATDGERTAYRELAAGGAPAGTALTWRAWDDASRRFAAALIADELQPGECVAILAGSSNLWPIADLGVLMAGGISVGLYPTSAPAQVRQIVADCAARVVVCDTAEQMAKVIAVRDELPSVRTTIALDPATTTAEGRDDGDAVRAGGLRAVVAADSSALPAGRHPDAIGWDAWLARGDAALAAGAGAEVDARIAGAGPDDTAILIYTSGSTGEPKGAEISHHCLLASAHSIVTALALGAGDTTLSFLPFCHAAERIFGLWSRVVSGMEAALVPDHTRVWQAAAAFRPTLFGGLPRFFEKAYEALHAEHLRTAGEERAAWDRTVEIGVRRSRLLQSGDAVPADVEREWREIGAPFFARAAALFGGRVRRVTSGGAALPREVAEYLDALGITVLGAYGLTEHLCVAMNRPGAYRFDTAGPAMPGTDIRIAGDGEVQVRRSALTFTGYWKRPADTAAAFTEDGWLTTGDLGELLDGGHLRVTGRKKELIALSTGKKVAPLPIEAALAQHPWIGQAMLYGEGQKFVSALISLRPTMLRQWSGEEDGDGSLDGLVIRHPDLLRLVQDAVDRVNGGLSRTEQIRRFVVIGRELTAENAELTPTLKLRRGVVAAKFRAELDALYQDAE